jgi:hypothetical protein
VVIRSRLQNEALDLGLLLDSNILFQAALFLISLLVLLRTMGANGL